MRTTLAAELLVGQNAAFHVSQFHEPVTLMEIANPKDSAPVRAGGDNVQEQPERSGGNSLGVKNQCDGGYRLL